MKNKLQTMLEMQAKLNLATNGSEWLDRKTKEGRDIDWYRCIRMEASELIDSYNWKHWKSLDMEPDIANARIEAVDIWHFILGEYLTVSNNVPIEDQAAELNDLIIERLSVIVNNFTTVQYSEHLISTTFSSDIQKSKIKLVIRDFIDLIVSLGMSMDDVYKLYLGKNLLNSFRQEHGYKDGTYIKEWFGKEDNVYVQDYIAKYPDAPVEVVWAYLLEQYKHVVGTPKKEETHIDRLKVERQELRDKMSKLKPFLDSQKTTPTIGHDQIVLLEEQYQIMQDYEAVLNARIGVKK